MVKKSRGRASGWTAPKREKWRGKGYHVGHCWKCGKEFAYMEKVYLPARKQSKVICPVCRGRMGV